MSACLALALALVAMPGDADEKILADAGCKTDGPGLIAFLKGLTPTARERDRLKEWVRQLGDASFVDRERASKALSDAGPVAVPLLRAALSSSDAEVVRRVTACLEEIDRTPHPQRLAAALRLLALRQPAGADQALLEYVAWAEEDGPSDDVLAALLAVGLKDAAPTPAVRTALADRSAACRAGAAYVVGKAASEHRKALAALLTDSSDLVRYHAAAALLIGGDRQAAPVLIELLADGALPLAFRAEELLLIAAGDSAPPVSLSSEAEARRHVQQAWRKWWADKGAKLDLSRVRFETGPPLGWTVICDFEIQGLIGHVRAIGRDGKQLWHFSRVSTPFDVRLLPGGRVLIADWFPKKVTECDRTGKVLWEAKFVGLGSSPVSCQRLADGNTFVATHDALLELTPAGKEVYRITRTGGRICCAEKLSDGRIVCIDTSGTVVEYDRDRKAVLGFKPSRYDDGAVRGASVQKLADEKYLLALGGSNRVVETDATGKILWEATVKAPIGAIRLPNGRTLVSCFDDKCVIELDAAGKEVWKVPVQHMLFRARRY